MQNRLLACLNRDIVLFTMKRNVFYFTVTQLCTVAVLSLPLQGPVEIGTKIDFALCPQTSVN